MSAARNAESVLEGRTIFDWAELADELAAALRDLWDNGARQSHLDVLAKYESWRPARNDGRDDG